VHFGAAVTIELIIAICCKIRVAVGIRIVTNPQLVLFCHISSFTQDAPVSARLGKVLIASPQYVAQFVVCQSNPSEIIEAYLMEHIQEEILYLPPPACIDVFKFCLFGKRSKIFFGSLSEIPTVFCSHIYNAFAYVLIGIVEYIIKECVKMFSEQLAQTIVRHSLM